MINNATIDIIYIILKNCETYKNDRNCSECTKKDTAECKGCQWLYIPEENGGKTLWGVEYLLGQIIRQVNIPTERRHLSKKAIEKWEELELEKDKIWDYNYQDKVKCNLSKEVTIEEFIGSSSKSQSNRLSGDCDFKFRNVFHDEHIVPINDVLNKLLRIPKDQLTHEEISRYLDKLHLCRILKSEDRNIRPKYNRDEDLDFRKIYENIYKKHEVIIPDLEN